MAVAFVAGITAAQNKASGTTIALTNVTTTAGELVVIGFTMTDVAGTISVADDAGNTYQIDCDVRNTNLQRTVIASSIHTTGLNGSQSITVTHPTVTAKVVAGARFSGVASSSWLDASSTAIQAAGTAWTSGASGTPIMDDEVVVGVIGIGRLSTNFNTIGTGMTPDQANTASTPFGTTGGGATSNSALALMYAIQTTATAQTADYSSATTNVKTACAVATYKGAVADPFPAGYQRPVIQRRIPAKGGRYGA